MTIRQVPSSRPPIPEEPAGALAQLVGDGVTWGDASEWLPRLPAAGVDLFFTSPPYADARPYSRVHRTATSTGSCPSRGQCSMPYGSATVDSGPNSRRAPRLPDPHRPRTERAPSWATVASRCPASGWCCLICGSDLPSPTWCSSARCSPRLVDDPT